METVQTVLHSQLTCSDTRLKPGVTERHSSAEILPYLSRCTASPSAFLVFLSTFRYTALNVPCEYKLSAELIDRLFLRCGLMFEFFKKTSEAEPAILGNLRIGIGPLVSF